MGRRGNLAGTLNRSGAASLVPALSFLFGLFLFATGFSLQTMMRNYWQEAEADGLRLQLYDLLSRLEVAKTGLPVVVEPMSDPRFGQPYSGYYWQLELGGNVVGRSRSLWVRRRASSPP